MYNIPRIEPVNRFTPVLPQKNHPATVLIPCDIIQIKMNEMQIRIWAPSVRAILKRIIQKVRSQEKNPAKLIS